MKALLLLATCFSAAASTYYVSTGGSDSHPGTREHPWRTAGFAAGKLRPGDTLHICGGTYYEQVAVSVSGTEQAPITIQSCPGERAILDSGVPEFRTPGNNDWELVDAATGEYRSARTYSGGNIRAYVAGIPGYENERAVLVPYKSAAAFRSHSDEYVDASTPFYVGPGTFHDPDDRRIHVRLSKTKEMRAAEKRYGVVFDAENADPRKYSIVLSQAATTLRISGAHLTLRNLTVHQAQHSIYLTADAHHVILEGITTWLGGDAIAVIGSHHVTIAGSRVYGDHPHWISWTDMKLPPAPADLLRTTSIDLRAGAHDVEIRYSHLRGSGQDLVGVNENETEVRVHHNRLDNCGDDAFELEGTVNVGRIWIYENYIGNCFLAVAPGQDTVRFDGPLYVYRNVFSLLRNPFINRKEGIVRWNGGGRYGFEYMFKHGTSRIYTTRNAHYYHNTMILLNTAGQGHNLTPKDPEGSRVANNLIIMVNGIVNRDYRTGPDQVVDGNLYWKVNTVDSAPLLAKYDTVAEFSAATGLEKRGIGVIPKRGTDPLFATFRLEVVDRAREVWELTPQSEVFQPTDFLLSAKSPAIGAGIAIPPHPVHGPLPDSRHSRDIGALPFGTPTSEYEVFPFQRK